MHKASCHINDKDIYTEIACVQSVLTFGTETWLVERTERIYEGEMPMDMCGVLLNDRKRSNDLYTVFLGIQTSNYNKLFY